MQEPLLRGEEVIEDVVDGLTNEKGTTVFQTLFNVVNIYVGIGLLSMPYALSLSGWVGLLSLASVVSIFCVAAHFIVHAFDRLPADCPRTYPDLGSAALGGTGRRLVVVFALGELFGTSCIVMLVIWQQLKLFLPDEGILGVSPMALAVALSAVGVGPLLLLGSFRRMSTLSLLGFVSSASVVLATCWLLYLDPHRSGMPVQPPPGHRLVNSHLAQGVGVFAMCVAGASTLPTLRSSMQRPARFPYVLKAAFGIMLGIYALLAAVGYWYWGDTTLPLLPHNISANSIFSAHSAYGWLCIDLALAGLILINCWTKLPAFIIVMQDMILSVLPLRPAPGQGMIYAPRVKLVHALRLALFAATVVVSYVAADALGSVLSLVGGGAAMVTSLLLPTAFHLVLSWRSRSAGSRAVLVVMAAGVTALVSGITLQSIQQLVHHHSNAAGEQAPLGWLAGWLRS